MDKKLIDYKGFEAYTKGVKDKYAEKTDIANMKISQFMDVYKLDKSIFDAIKNDQNFIDAINRDIFTFVTYDEHNTRNFKRDDGCSSYVFYKGATIGVNPFFAPVPSPLDVKDNLMFNDLSFVNQAFMRAYNRVIQNEIQAAQPSYVPFSKLDSLTQAGLFFCNNPNLDSQGLLLNQVKSSGFIHQFLFLIDHKNTFVVKARTFNGNTEKWQSWKIFWTSEALDSKIAVKADKSELPTKLSQLTNDKNYKTESEIQSMIEKASSLKKEVVTSLPTTGKDDVIYLVKDDKGQENNNYLEYLWLNGKYELIGSTQVDLKNYARKIEIKTQLSEMTEDTTHRTVTDTEKNKWNNKVDKVDGKGLSTNDYTDEDKGKINAIPPNPKYTDTIPDLTPYAKKENIPTKVSQLENDNNYITGKETLFLNTFNGVYKILDGWNNFYFNQGWQLCESDDQPDSPCDNKQRTKYLVYTAFNAKVDDNGLNPILSEEVWQFAWHNLSGTWFCRRGTPRNDEKPTFHGQIQNDDNSFHYCYTISPKWSKWVANKSNIDIQEFTQQELEEAFR